MSRPREGSLVIVDWRGNRGAGEPGKLRPAVVVENHELFPDSYPTTLVAPLTHDGGLAHPTFAVRIDPTPENGADSTCWALAHHLTSVSLERLRSTGASITTSQLADLRSRVVLAIGG
jgi:mRNA-degrading endonuclease toxin of MazEF toxin-antitoxin module